MTFFYSLALSKLNIWLHWFNMSEHKLIENIYNQTWFQVKPGWKRFSVSCSTPFRITGRGVRRLTTMKSSCVARASRRPNSSSLVPCWSGPWECPEKWSRRSPTIRTRRSLWQNRPWDQRRPFFLSPEKVQMLMQLSISFNRWGLNFYVERKRAWLPSKSFFVNNTYFCL